MWDESTDETSDVTYDVFRDGDYLESISSTSYEDQTVFPSMEYTFSVQAVDASGNHSLMSDEIVIQTEEDTIEPNPPTIVEVSHVNNQSIELYWNAGVDNIAIKEYQVYRNGTVLGTTDLLEYTDNTVEENNSYIYWIVSVDYSGNISTNSISIEETTPEIIDAGVLTRPTNVVVNQQDASTIEISWEQVVDEVEIASYSIYRNGEYIGTSTECIYTDIVSAIDKYTYQVQAIDTNGNESELSVGTNIEIQLEIPTNFTLSGNVNSVAMSWDEVSFTDDYEIQYNGETTIEVDELEYTQIVSEGELCHYKIRAKAGDIYSDWSSEYNIQLLSRVTNLQAEQDLNHLDITWDEVVGAENYEVLINSQLMDTVTTNTYTMDGYENSTNYSIAIRASSNQAVGVYGTLVYAATVMTDLSGVISTDTVLTKANSPYNLSRSLTINEGVELTIEPGVIIKSASSVYKITVNGRLKAIGSEIEPIIITSKTDSPSDKWMGIEVMSTGEFVGDFLEVRYGGYYNKYSNIYTEGDLMLTNSKISDAYSAYYNIIVNTTGNKTVIIDNNEIQSDKNGIKITKFDQGVLSIKENKFNNIEKCMLICNMYSDQWINIVDNQYINCQENKIWMYNSPGVNWNLPEENYRLDRDIVIPEGVSVTVQAGAQFICDGKDIVVDGELVLSGNTKKPIKFMCTENLSYQHWGGIHIRPSGTLYAEYAEISGGYIKNVYSEGNITIMHSKLKKAYNNTPLIIIDCATDKTVVIESNTFSEENIGIEVENYSGENFSIRDNLFLDVLKSIKIMHSDVDIYR